MMSVFLFVSILLAGGSLYLLGDFLFWVLRGRIVRAKILSFQDKTNKGLLLPFVVFRNESGQALRAPAERIDQFQFLFNRPQEDDFITVYYINEDQPRLRVYGYINVIAAGFLLVPLLISIAIESGKAEALGQGLYTLIFAVIILGGWVLLKLIQRYY